MRMVFAFVMSVVLAMNALATTWYVADNGGSDSNSGKSQSSAFKTIQKAVDKSKDGDTILVADGTYAGFSLENLSTTTTTLDYYKRAIRSVNGVNRTAIVSGVKMGVLFQ